VLWVSGAFVFGRPQRNQTAHFTVGCNQT